MNENETIGQFAANSKKEIEDLKRKYSNILWKNQNLQLSPETVQFKGSETLSAEIISLSTPLQIFKYFFNDELMSKIVEESNYYSAELNIDNPTKINEKDLQAYIGICTMTSMHHVTNLRRYWSLEVGN